MLAVALYFDEVSLSSLKKISKKIIALSNAKNNFIFLEAPSLHLTLYAEIPEKFCKEIEETIESIKSNKISIYSNGLGIFLNKRLNFHFRWQHDDELVNFRNNIKKIIEKYIKLPKAKGYGENDWIAKTSIFSSNDLNSEFIHSMEYLMSINQNHNFFSDKIILIRYNELGKEDIIYSKTLHK